jgi:hypothetical protein
MAMARASKWRRWIGAGVAVVVVAVAIIVVAQSGGGGGTSLNAIAKAAEVTQREAGGHATFDARITIAGSPEGLAESGSMVFDEQGRSAGTVTAKGLSTGKEFTAQMIGDGLKTYMSSDALGSISGGKKWVEMNLTAAAKATGSSAGSDSATEGLKLLETVEDAEKVGSEEIDGVPTTHWRGTLPAASEIFGVKTHFSDLKVDAWIDAKQRIRQMKVVISGNVNEAEPEATTAMTINYVNFGEVPAIEPPPADEVFDATHLIESNVQKAAEGG